MKKNWLFCLLIPAPIIAKVLIITHSYNRPDFIEMQYKTFKKCLEDDYEFVVFNDARETIMVNQINDMCTQCKLRCIRIPQEIHSRPYLPRLPNDPLDRPNIRHANCVQYSMDILGFNHPGIVFIIDSDMFLIRRFNISQYMRDKHIASFIKTSGEKVWYVCPALCMFDMNTLPDKRSMNFNCGEVHGESVDSGGWTYLYLIAHPELIVARANATWSYQLFLANMDINHPADHMTSNEVKINAYRKLGFNEREIKFLLKKPDTFEFFLDNNFLHYHGGTNHNNLSSHYHDTKLRIFNELIDDIVQN